MADPKKDDEPANPNADPMAAFGPHLSDMADALDVLYIPNNASGRLKFRDKWDVLAGYILCDELVDYDINGVKDYDRRKVLEEQANERRLKLKATLKEIVEKSVKSGQLQFDYVGRVIDEYGATLSEHFYAGNVVERVRPGLLKKEQDAAGDKETPEKTLDQKLSVDEAAILKNTDKGETFDESDYNDVKPIVTDAPTGKPGKMRDALDDMVSDFKSDSFKTSTDGIGSVDGAVPADADVQSVPPHENGSEDDTNALENAAANQIEGKVEVLQSGDGALEDPKTELLDIMDVVEKQDDLSDVSDVENTLPDPKEDVSAVADEVIKVAEPKSDAVHSAAQVEPDMPVEKNEPIAEKIDHDVTPDEKPSLDDVPPDAQDIEEAVEIDDRGVFGGRGSAKDDDADVDDDFWEGNTQDQSNAPKEESPKADIAEAKPASVAEVTPPPVSDSVAPASTDTPEPVTMPDIQSEPKAAPIDAEPAPMPEDKVAASAEPNLDKAPQSEAVAPSSEVAAEAPISNNVPEPEVVTATPAPAAEAKAEPVLTEPVDEKKEDVDMSSKPSVFGSPTLAGEKKQEPYSGMFNRLACVTSEESLGVEI